MIIPLDDKIGIGYESNLDYPILKKRLVEKLDRMTFTPYMVPFWVETIMDLVKVWAEEELRKQIKELEEI